ncbi:MAG: thiamine diphosphokinase [Chloroflexota bacterium]
MRAIVFANGLIDPLTDVCGLLRADDLLLAADGGSRHCQERGIVPHAVVGDLDSFDMAMQQAWAAAGVKFYRYPSRKNFTDLELALQHAIMQGADEIVVFGALGARWDQTVANLLLPIADGLRDAHVRLLDGLQEIMLLHGGSLKLSGRPGDTVSLIPLGGDAVGITTQGLEYPLLGGTLYFGATRGISNVMLAHEAGVQLQSGLLLCVLIHQAEPLSPTGNVA